MSIKMKGQEIADRLRRQLHDLRDQNDNPLVSSFRWSDEEFMLYIVDAQREIVNYRPDATAEMALLPLTVNDPVVSFSGEQNVRLIDVYRNMNGTQAGRAVRVVRRDDMDRWNPAWMQTSGNQVSNYVYDERFPLQFYVYPQINTSGRSLQVCLSKRPMRMLNLNNDLRVHRIYLNAVVDYCLFRALSRDIDGPAYRRAAMFYKNFANNMGIKMEADLSSSPNMAATQRKPLNQ